MKAEDDAYAKNGSLGSWGRRQGSYWCSRALWSRPCASSGWVAYLNGENNGAFRLGLGRCALALSVTWRSGDVTLDLEAVG